MKKSGALFITGGILYVIIELLWRQKSHISMFFAGGTCLALIDKVCNHLICRKKTWVKCLVGSGIITLVEFITGVVVNLQLKLNVWDYSMTRFNLLGANLPPVFFFLVLFNPAGHACGEKSECVFAKKAPALLGAALGEKGKGLKALVKFRNKKDAIFAFFLF